jgi:pentapeptide MXKDX repeat protein
LRELRHCRNSLSIPNLVLNSAWQTVCNFGTGNTSHLRGRSVPPQNLNDKPIGEFMKKMFCSLMTMCFLTASLTAFAQSGDAMKQDSMKHDDMKQEQMKKDDMKKDKKSTKTKKDKGKKNDMKKDDSMKQN